FSCETDVPRNLVGGNPAAAVLADLVDGGRLPVVEPDPDAHLFTVLDVRHADGLHVADFRMRVQELFDLARVDVFAAPNDHVLQPAHDVDVAVLAHHGKIAGVHPARAVDCGGRRGRVVPVSQHHGVPPRAQLAGPAARHDRAG